MGVPGGVTYERGSVPLCESHRTIAIDSSFTGILLSIRH
jgi:hypothetical protein